MSVRLMQIVYQIKLLLTAVVGRTVLNNQLDNNDNIFLTLVIDCIFIAMKMCSIYLKHFVFAVLVSSNKYR